MNKCTVFTILFIWRKTRSHIINHHLIYKTFLTAILVQYCRRDTTREWLDTTLTTRIARETMVYGLYRSWINGDMHIISNTAPQPRQYDPYDRTGRTGRETMVHESYNWWTA